MNKIDQSIYENLELRPLDLQGWNGNSEVFRKLIEEVEPKNIIEVGSWKGQSSINMANIIKSLSLNTKITCVDTWLGAQEFWGFLNNEERNLSLKNGYPTVYYQFLSNVVHTNNQEIILPFPATSRIAFYHFQANRISADMIYIDASHDYEDVRDDIYSYYNLLNNGGVIFGDDFHAWPGVNRAVQEFVQQNSLNLEIFENNFWIIRK